ncbi:MAG: uridine kinase [candidate division KSB1 bacterium]|nr:uridine kinase [candidate division KSB1 bacterium]MDZ7305259.1 uridine kinase [candidate division KSB1 bacterium]MDZ7312043.1 uridine kinase [candidate division KSB1 bacterium]
MARGILIGVAGGSGSGKTLVVQHMIQQLGSDRVVVLQQDSYYKDLSHLPFEERVKQNFDHPDAIDTELLIRHVEELLNGCTVDIPIYDFTIHTRRAETRRAGPHDIIVLEGILILDNPRLREMMDIKVYVDTDPDIRFIRRLKRDTIERGRTVQSIIEQYEKTVRPMHLQFVEPTKRYADIIVPEGGYNWVAIDLLKTKIEALLRERQ